MEALRRVITPVVLCALVGGLLALAVVATTPVSNPPAGPRVGAASLELPVRMLKVTNLRNAGPGSLRAAILIADSRPRHSITMIDFSVAGIIRITERLPAVSRPTVIDGTLAPGHRLAGPPVVEIDFRGHRGLLFSQGADESQLLGLAIDNASGDGVRLFASSITVSGDFIGLDLAGHAYGNRGDGLFLASKSAHDLIGLDPSGAAGAVANVISANGKNGIEISGSSDNMLVSNRIGTNPAGTYGIANASDGLLISVRANYNLVGPGNLVNGPVVNQGLANRISPNRILTP